MNNQGDKNLFFAKHIMTIKNVIYYKTKSKM